ncbi:MAG: imidazole glycerol phosphate synthase subunit HisH [Bacteroidota bacterium]
MNIAIVKYNAGNIRSVIYALDRLGYTAKITDNPALLASADKVIFPGVGEASTAMKYLRERGLDKVLIQLKQPILGICLGMQLMCKYSEERDTECLGIFDENVVRFSALVDGVRYKVPHMGWNGLTEMSGVLTKGLKENDYVYFVHSYFVELGAHTKAMTNYGTPFSAILESENYFATQFHPEKSGDVGEQILKNFLEL